MRPLAVYIHWPFCKSKCPYCDFNSHVRDGVDNERWKAALLSELNYMSEQIDGHEVASIFFGGGTPSLMPPSTAEALIDRVHQLWPVSGNIEITLEANPTSVESSTFTDFRQAGVNRASLGVQSLDSDSLRFLGRGHSAPEALKAVDLARNTFDRYSFDLIYARPKQTLAQWEAELTEAMKYIGGHMSLYQLTIEENTAFHHAYKNGGFTLPSEEEAEELYHLTESMLSAKGLIAYEVSNYAKPGEESRHNLAYWQGHDYIGIGSGAHGRITIDNIRIATQTLKSPERWLENVEKNGHAMEIWDPIGRQREVEERVMMGLRLSQGIFYDAFQEQTGYDLRDYIHKSHRDLYVANGLLADDSARLQTSLRGRLVLNTLTAELLN